MDNKNNKSASGIGCGVLVVLIIIIAALLFSCDSGTSSSSKRKSYSSGVTGAGGYDMPNKNDKSFADYVKRVDPGLYNDMKDRYNSAVK